MVVESFPSNINCWGAVAFEKIILAFKTYLPVLVFTNTGKYVLHAKTETKIIFGTSLYSFLKNYSTSASNIQIKKYSDHSFYNCLPLNKTWYLPQD